AINSIIESRDTIFDEHRFSSVLRPIQRSLVKGNDDSGGSVVSERVIDEIDNPKTFDEAMKSQNVAFWKEAINDEMDSIMGNNTWVLTDLPPGCRPLGYKWIFKKKLKMDVKTAFLNGELEEEVYMNQPLGFIVPGNKNKVCKLIKSLYGLKQAPKQWHQKFDEVVLTNGYLLNQADKFVYRKFDTYGKGVIIYLYVDGMLIFGTNQVQMDLTKEFLSLRFSMKDTREADAILGIRIKHESNGISISQSYYIEKVLKKFNYTDCTPINTPLDTCEKLMPNKGLARVLKYLKKTMDYRLVYSGYPLVLEGYTDASWISNTEDNSSTSGLVFLLGGGAISWASKKQTCITGSTMEYEFVALAAAGKETEWLKNLLLEIPLWVKPMAPISICYDSAATLAKAYSQIGLKHVFYKSSQGCAWNMLKEGKVFNFSMVNFFEKVLSKSMNKEEPPM
nr:hypothetical protein [Tanacetum cinerariifolium]